jgi:hypothetical protein
MKAVAWSLVFLIFLIGLTITATILVFWGWWNPFKESTSKYACELKIQRYCQELVCGMNPDVDLTGCTEEGAVPDKNWCESHGFSCKKS